VRDGKSFCTRSVVARQSAGAILNMIASFQLPEEAAEVQTVPAPQLPGPDEGREAAWNELFDRRSVRRRHLDPDDPRACAWFKIKGELPDDPLLHACALAYISDDLPTEAVIARHPAHVNERTTPFWNASLDHAIWFHDTLRADAYHLYDFGCHALRASRGLTIGHVFDAAGKHVATINQEVLLRELKKG
jgi:acyl-CoA thioesterase-2